MDRSSFAPDTSSRPEFKQVGVTPDSVELGDAFASADVAAGAASPSRVPSRHRPEYRREHLSSAQLRRASLSAEPNHDEECILTARFVRVEQASDVGRTDQPPIPGGDRLLAAFEDLAYVGLHTVRLERALSFDRGHHFTVLQYQNVFGS